MKTSYEPILIGRSELFLSEVPSTNQFLHEYLSKSKPDEGLVVYTDFQSSGRGQIGRSWESNKGENILMSLYLTPRFLSVAQSFYLNIIISLAISSMIKDINEDARVEIKWPNDVYVNKRKASGILIKNTLQGNHIEESIIGIGLNVNQDHFTTENAISLTNVTDEKHDLRSVRHNLYQYIEQYYFILKSKNFDNLKSSYEDQLYRKDQISNYRLPQGEKVFTGQILGIDDSGLLILNTHQGIKKFHNNEIIYL